MKTNFNHCFIKLFFKNNLQKIRYLSLSLHKFENITQMRGLEARYTLDLAEADIELSSQLLRSTVCF